MTDTKLFRVSATGVTELEGRSARVEKSLQTLLERQLEAFLGVRFLASEHSTGQNQRGRIDTLGLDENGSPVIIEYKRATNQNVINQGLFYLDWLMDHRKEFQWLVMEKLGNKAAETVDWSGPRLLCIAGDFTRYDEHAIKQIDRNIELIRYRHYGDDLLLLELVNAASLPADDTPRPAGEGGRGSAQKLKTVTEQLAAASTELTDRFLALKAYLLALGDDVQIKATVAYLAFRRFKNFACVEFRVRKGHILVFVKVDPDKVDLAANKRFLRDVRKLGHFGTGDLEITIGSDDDIDRAKPYILKSYEVS